MTEFNIIGTVNASKPLLGTDYINYRLKEIFQVDRNLYDKLKKNIMEKPVIDPMRDALEKQKDERFQGLFKELWPNVYDRIGKKAETTKPKEESAKFLSDLDRNRAMIDLMVKEDLEKYRLMLASGKNLSTCHTHCHCAECYPSTKDAINIRIEGLGSGKPNFSISQPKSEPEKKPPPKLANYPNLLSSYDFPYNSAKHNEQLVKSPYNPSDLTDGIKLLQSLKESQDKLKMSKKVEKTTDIVDDIINKVKVLQEDMKKKSAMIKIEKDMEDFKKEHHKLFHKEHDHLHHKHHHHHLHNNDHSKYLDNLRSQTSLGIHGEKDFSHRHLSRSRDRASLSRRVSLSSSRSVSRERGGKAKKLVSILKTPSSSYDVSSESDENDNFKVRDQHRRHHHIHTHQEHQHRTRSKSNSRKKSSDKNLAEVYGSDWKRHVEPKVKCWNCNCKHDKNVY